MSLLKTVELSHIHRYFVSSDTVAKQKSKKHFFHECVFCGWKPLTNLQGMHIYPAGSYSQFKTLIYNIIPGCQRHHKFLDWIPDSKNILRTPVERIAILRLSILNEHRKPLNAWLDTLIYVVNEYENVKFNGGIKINGKM